MQQSPKACGSAPFGLVHPSPPLPLHGHGRTQPNSHVHPWLFTSEANTTPSRAMAFAAPPLARLLLSVP